MSLADEIKKVLTENPSILADVLASHPEIIYQVLAKLTPWQNLATKQDVEEIKKVMATKQDIEEIKKTMATKQELEEIKKVMATKQDIEEIKKTMATKQELEEVKKEIEGIKKVMATKQDIKTLEVMISALGTRWGILAEDVFRKGMMELLSNTNWKVDREIIFDKEGIVYGYPSEVEIDVIISDGKVILVELTASLKRSDLIPFSKKKELYEKEKGRKVSEVVVITPFIDDKNEERIIAIAKSLGIRIIKPSEINPD
ncbi:MAG: PD-(D/E)XK nuclease family protein [Sulfolobaceae archaeon]